MEGNKDEAEKCIQMAVRFISQGNSEKAEKFLNKAMNLFPSDKAKGMIENPLNLTEI